MGLLRLHEVELAYDYFGYAARNSGVEDPAPAREIAMIENSFPLLAVVEGQECVLPRSVFLKMYQVKVGLQNRSFRPPLTTSRASKVYGYQVSS